jgi:hypothetical protein
LKAAGHRKNHQDVQRRSPASGVRVGLAAARQGTASAAGPGRTHPASRPGSGTACWAAAYVSVRRWRPASSTKLTFALLPCSCAYP